MSAYLYAAEVNDLEWLFDEADGAVKGLRSTWSDETLADATKHVASQLVRLRIKDGTGERWVSVWQEVAPLRCGPMYVSKKRHAHRATYEMSPRSISAATRQRRVWSAYISSRWPDVRTCSPPPGVLPSEVLRLRFREPLLRCREVFGRAGFAAETKRPLDIERKVNVRGPGNLAHLVDATRSAWAADRTALEIGPWTDRLGRRLDGLEGKGSLRVVATPGERQLSRAIIRECAALELWALEAYRRAVVRVPERVRRAGLAA